MEFVKYFLISVFYIALLFWCISFIASVFFFWVIMSLYEFFSRTKCLNCAKAIRGEAIRCPRCGSPLTDEVPQEKINTKLYARVRTLVAEQRSESEEELTPDTRLQDDLGVDGDDGDELIVAFCEEFEIENMGEIDLTKHFGPEGINPFEIYVILYYWVFDREKLRYHLNMIPITLRDLVKSAEARRWVPPAAEF